MQPLSQWVFDARAKLGLTQEQFGEKINVSKGNVSAWEKGRHRPTLDKIVAIARVAGVPLPKELEEARADNSFAYDQPAQPADLRVLPWDEPSDIASDRYVWIKRRQLKLDAGSGNIVFEDEDKMPLPFLASWLRDMSLKPDDAVLVYARGDSMTPTFVDGDMLLVNLADTSVKDGEVYALRYQDQLRVKRLYRRFDNALILHSDNEARYQQEVVPPEYLDGHVHVVGRVVWRAGPL